MSATGRGNERVEQDFYPTPDWCVHRFLEKCPLPLGKWLEPAAGDCAIIKAANDFYRRVGKVQRRPDWHALELRSECQKDVSHFAKEWEIGNFLDGSQFPDVDRFDVILTNPPFSLAQEFIEMSLMRSRYVAMLLRLNFIGSEDRAPFWKEFPPDVYVLPNRPSFCVFTRDQYACKPCGSTKNVPEGDLPPFCTKCGGPTIFKGKKMTHSDSTEYAFFVWSEERRREKGNIMVLDPTPADVRAAAVKLLKAA
jgi:hypothetical protein